MGGHPPGRPKRRASSLRYRVSIIPWVVLLAMTPSGCRRSDTPEARTAKGFVAFVGVGEDDPRWPVLCGTARRIHADLGLGRLPLRTLAPPISSVNAQKDLLLKLRDEGLVGACVQVADPRGLTTALEALIAQGVQVITMLQPATGSGRLTESNLDDAGIGTALAEATVDAVSRKGLVAVLHADSVEASSAKRHAAFRARLAAQADVHLILEYDCQADPARARQILRETMERYPRLKAWAIVGDWPLRALKDDAPLVPPPCRLLAVDPVPEHWPLLADGRVYAMIAPRYDQIAEHAVKSCYSKVLGEVSLASSFDAGVETVWASSLEAFKARWAAWSSETPPPGK